LESETKHLKEDEKSEPELLFEKLDALHKAIDGNMKKLASQKQIIKELKTSLEKSDFASVLHSLRKEAIDSLRLGFPQSVEILRRLEEVASSQVQPQVFSFDKDLKEALGKAELRLEWWFPDVIEGKFPSYLINKVIEVTVDQKDFSVRINKQKVDSMDTRLISSVIINENDRLLRRQYDGQKFIEELYKAYEVTLLRNRKTLGDAVHLKEVYKAMLFEVQKTGFFEQPTRQNFVPYLPDEFVVDLSRSLKNGPTMTGTGMKLELHPLRDPKDCFFVVYPNGDRVYRGLLSFKKADLK